MDEKCDNFCGKKKSTTRSFENGPPSGFHTVFIFSFWWSSNNNQLDEEALLSQRSVFAIKIYHFGPWLSMLTTDILSRLIFCSLHLQSFISENSWLFAYTNHRLFLEITDCRWQEIFCLLFSNSWFLTIRKAKSVLFFPNCVQIIRLWEDFSHKCIRKSKVDPLSSSSSSFRVCL